MRMILLAVVVLAVLAGCKTRYVTVETVRTEYVSRTDTLVQRDSVWAHDSIHVREKGDTVWVERWSIRYQDRWRDRVHTDTIVRVDSVQVPYPVERKLSKWQQWCLDWGKVTTGGTIALLAIGCWLLVGRKKSG